MKYLDKQTNELMNEQGNKYTETTTNQNTKQSKITRKLNEHTQNYDFESGFVRFLVVPRGTTKMQYFPRVS